MKKVLSNLEEYLIAVLICGMILFETINAVLHVIGSAAVGFPQELAIFCYVWIAFLSASFCAKRGCDVAVNMLSSKYSPKVQRTLGIVCLGINVFLSVCLLIGACSFVAKTGAAGTLGKATQLPMTVVYASSVVGYILCLVRNVQALAAAMKAPKN